MERVVRTTYAASARSQPSHNQDAPDLLRDGRRPTRPEEAAPPSFAGCRVKVFGVGCPRSGTTTLGDCLAILGLSGTSFHETLFHEVLDGRVEGAIEYARRFEAFDDLPWCLLYRELDRAFPGSKFVLTIRRDTATWLRSFRKQHVTEHGALLSEDGSRAVYRTHDYPIWPSGRSGYEAHNAAVREYFSGRPGALLTVCWERGSGWKDLAEFLGLPIPDAPFPHSNRTHAAQTALKVALLHLRRALRL